MTGRLLKKEIRRQVKMKQKIILSLIALILLVGSISAFGATSTTSTRTMLNAYKMNITMVNQEPDPAEAGRYVTIRFKIENSGAENAEDITVELLPEYPFSLDRSEERRVGKE